MSKPFVYKYQCPLCGIHSAWPKKHRKKHPGQILKFISIKVANPRYEPKPQFKVHVGVFDAPLELIPNPAWREGGDIPFYLPNY
jgi:hypothetical protein